MILWWGGGGLEDAERPNMLAPEQIKTDLGQFKVMERMYKDSLSITSYFSLIYNFIFVMINHLH